MCYNQVKLLNALKTNDKSDHLNSVIDELRLDLKQLKEMHEKEVNKLMQQAGTNSALR